MLSLARSLGPRRPGTLWVAVAVCVGPTVAAAQSPHPSGFAEAWADVTATWDAAIQREGIVGSSLAFVADGRFLAHEVRGLADEATGRAVDENTIYHWASITKTFTAVAIMQLRDEGRLSLDDPIVGYVPELRRMHDPDGWLDRVTIRHLLSHSAGFRASTFPWGNGEDWYPHEPTEWDQLVAMLPYTRFHFEPGERFSYSNPGIVFLGQVIERLSGEDFEVHVDKNVLRPLGMHRSYFDVTPRHLLRDRSNNYFVEGGARRANGLDFDTGITVSNGGLNAPISDMALYLAFLQGGAARRSVHEGILQRSSLEEMWQPVVPIESDDSPEVAMGLGYFLLAEGGLEFIGHTGGQLGFISFFYVHPESRTAAIAAFNTLGLDDPPKPDTRAVLSEVRHALFSGVFPLFASQTTDRP